MRFTIDGTDITVDRPTRWVRGVPFVDDRYGWGYEFRYGGVKYRGPCPVWVQSDEDAKRHAISLLEKRKAALEGGAP